MFYIAPVGHVGAAVRIMLGSVWGDRSGIDAAKLLMIDYFSVIDYS